LDKDPEKRPSTKEETKKSDNNYRNIQDRAMGCVMGAFIGDSSGGFLEFASQDKINRSSVNKAM